ncbi:MAG: DEAD/DEAH box helicase [Candidatus Omnitrophica bacterium]|nr:DEAD/DEAH box helicase [Candidatus Omnitrophota bacterium]MCF7893438.1 DEAD/DEAH box helicase [Candidatus Omnitrophota bacterium]
MLEKFKKLGLSRNALSALEEKGFEEPTKIQEEIIPLFLKGNYDIVGQAQTGTGKTAAFGLPLVEKITNKIKVPQAIILTPTRELAVQVAEEINSLKGSNFLEVAAIYGGQSINLQLKRLKKGVDIVVGTPGRVKDHLLRKTLDLSAVNYFILDEADEMLNMGFIEDVEEILSYATKDKRVLLFSATMPNPILKLARKYMKDYKLVKVSQDQLTVGLTDQIYFEVNSSNKFEALCRIIDSEPEFYGLIFCRTKINVDKLAKKLGARGYDSDALHGDISQSQRERILDRFRQKRINVLVATDVAARGIDVSDLTHVINFSLPQDPRSYVHRIGRTGRAGRSGTAITFVTPDEYRKLVYIKRITKTDIRKKKIPGVEDVISSRKLRIKKSIIDLINSKNTGKHGSFAEKLLEENDPRDVVSALIEYSSGQELDKSKYSKIKEPYVDKKGTTRLFIAKGKADKMTASKIVDMIRKASKIDQKKISDVSVFDKFSFITVSFKEAEKILDAFKKLQSGRKPLVERAKRKGKKKRFK